MSGPLPLRGSVARRSESREVVASTQYNADHSRGGGAPPLAVDARIRSS